MEEASWTLFFSLLVRQCLWGPGLTRCWLTIRSANWSPNLLVNSHFTCNRISRTNTQVGRIPQILPNMGPETLKPDKNSAGSNILGNLKVLRPCQSIAWRAKPWFELCETLETLNPSSSSVFCPSKKARRTFIKETMQTLFTERVNNRIIFKGERSHDNYIQFYKLGTCTAM